MTKARKPLPPERSCYSFYWLLREREREAFQARLSPEWKPPSPEPTRAGKLEDTDEIRTFYNLAPRMLGQRKRPEGEE